MCVCSSCLQLNALICDRSRSQTLSVKEQLIDLKVALQRKQEVVNIIHTLCNYPYNHLAIYFHFTEFESCSINSTRGTDEAHCRALQERLPSSASGRYALFF